MVTDQAECVRLGWACRAAPPNATACTDGYQCFVDKLLGPFLAGNHNFFDMRAPCDRTANSLCYDFHAIADYLNLERVRAYLNVDPIVGVWGTIDQSVADRFLANGDFYHNTHTYVADALNDGLRVLIYAGDADLMCNWQGSRAWTLELEWAGQAGFNAAKERALISHDPLVANASASCRFDSEGEPGCVACINLIAEVFIDGWTEAPLLEDVRESWYFAFRLQLRHATPTSRDPGTRLDLRASSGDQVAFRI
ncbi:hypothetical protein PybrP1_009218 [[Pythium] brassicae (nom. inval.)]|nr:hypothetical protein PybrP1_009218 [[Pythium] brassicae (nom. inval.)]